MLHFNRELINLFSDKEGGGFFLYGKDSEKLIFKPKETYDGAIPSGNSVALYNISRLLKITEDEGLENLVSKAFNDFGGKVKESLESHAFFLISFMFMKEGNGKIVIVGNFHHKDTLDMLCEINERFLPFYTILLKDKEEELQKISPYIEGHSMINNKTSIYLCDNNSCHEPVNNKDDLRDLLDKNK